MITVNVVGMVTTDPAVGRASAVAVQRGLASGVRRSMPARALMVLVALVSAPGVAAASPFVWHAPAGCPDAADVRTRIERRLGASLDATVHGIEISVVRERGTFVAQIDARALTVANDVRTLRSARCDELADAVAVIVARLASEARAHADSAPAGEPLASMVPDTRRTGGARAADAARIALDAEYDPPVDEPATAAVAVASPRRDRLRRWGAGLHLTGLSGVGALPQLNLGAELAGYVRRLDRFVELGAGLWVPQSAPLNAGAPARVEVSLQVVTLRAGWGPRDLPLRAWVTAEVGRIQGIGVAVDDPQAGSSRWTALGGGFNVAWPMSPLARLVGAIELMIPLERTVFMLADGRDLYQPSSATARCSLGIEVGWK